MEPQPQLQPINPVEGRPFAEPPRPLNLQPKRQPLDLRPRPNYRPLDVPDLRPARGEELRPSMNPLDRSNTQGAREAVGRVVNNPLGYTPGKALAAPLGMLNRSRELHDQLSTPEPLETLDVPAIPLPADSFTPTSPTSKLGPDAIGQGSPLDQGEPAVPGGPGSRAIPYQVSYTNPSTVTYSTGEVIQGGLTSVQPLGVRTGPLSVVQQGDPAIVYLIHANGSDSLGAGSSTRTLQQWNNSIGQYVTVTITATAYPQIFPTALDGTLDPDAQPATPPRHAPNPARQPFPGELPDFLEMPELDLPGFQPEPRLLPPPAPTGEITPYRPPAWEPDPAEPYLPPDPYKTPGFPTAPDLSTPPGESRQGDPNRRGTLAPPWWDAWENFQPPDPWTNSKRNPRGEDNPQLPAPQTAQQPPPVAVVPYDGCCVETLNRLRDIQRRLEKLEVDSEIPVWKCDTTADPPTPTEERNSAKDLKTAVNLIGESLGLIQQQLTICPPPPVEQAKHAEIAKDTATEGKTVWYIPLAPEVRQVELIITGKLPRSFRLYDTSADGEQQAKFGAISLSCAGVTGGNTANSFHQWAWTRRTSMYVGNRSPRENFLRVYIRSGLSWVLYDTGLRE